MKMNSDLDLTPKPEWTKVPSMKMTEEELEELRQEMALADGQDRELCHHRMTDGSECGSFHSCCHDCSSWD